MVEEISKINVFDQLHFVTTIHPFPGLYIRFHPPFTIFEMMCGANPGDEHSRSVKSGSGTVYFPEVLIGNICPFHITSRIQFIYKYIYI